MEYEERRRKEIKEGVVALAQFVTICVVGLGIVGLFLCGAGVVETYLSGPHSKIVEALISIIGLMSCMFILALL